MKMEWSFSPVLSICQNGKTERMARKPFVWGALSVIEGCIVSTSTLWQLQKSRIAYEIRLSSTCASRMISDLWAILSNFPKTSQVHMGYFWSKTPIILYQPLSISSPDGTWYIGRNRYQCGEYSGVTVLKNHPPCMQDHIWFEGCLFCSMNSMFARVSATLVLLLKIPREMARRVCDRL